MLIKTKNLLKVIELGETLLNATLLFRIDEEIFSLAWRIFKEQRNPNLSFTDCTSIALCRLKGLSSIASFDKDFYKFKDFKVIGLV